MAINFPDSPNNGDTHTAGGKTFTYDSTVGGWTPDPEGLPVNVGQHWLPVGDEVYDLGSSTNKWRDLYVSAGTINLGDAKITTDETNGNVAIIPPPTTEVPNPTALVVTQDGRTTTTATTAGAVNFTQVQQQLATDPGFDVDLSITPETFTINVDFPSAGHGTNWLWSWDAGTVAYARIKIENQQQSVVPLYHQGTYTVNNFAAHDLHGSMTQTHKIYLKWIEGAGTDNNVSWSTSTLNVTGVTHPAINGGQATEVQRLVINVPSTITAPTLTAPTVDYNVSFANTGYYTFTGSASGDNVTLGPIYKGGTYTFNLDSSLSGHPFYLTTDDGTNFSAGSYVGEYTSGVTGSRNQSGTLVFVVPSDAPDTLYYQCGNHSAMRGQINIKPLEVETYENGNYKLYFQHDQEQHVTPVEIKPVPTIGDIGNLCLVYDATDDKFKVKDMGEYLDDTTQFQAKIQKIVETNTTQFATTASLPASVRDNTPLAINVHKIGSLEVSAGTKRWYAPFNLEVSKINAKLGGIADADVVADVKKNGSSAQTVTVSAGNTSGTVSNPTLTMAEGDYLTVDITNVGTSAIGSDLYLQFIHKRT